jgi:hypothetical protein
MATRLTCSRRLVLAALTLVSLMGAASLFLPTPAYAQFPFFDWGDQPRRRAPAPTPRQQPQFNPFGAFEPSAPEQPIHRERRPPRRPYVERERPPVDPARAPAARPKEGTPATTVLVLGDAMADWLAYGLEDAYSEDDDVAISRKNRANAGLIRNESRSEPYDAVTATKGMLAGEKADFIVVMMGVVDRQAIRERPAKAPPSPDQPSIAAEAQSGLVTHEFRSDRWTELYTKRIDDMIAVLKSKGVPVLWVGLPVIRGARARAEVAYLNELYKGRAEKAGITYVDVWDGFADENGDYAQYGPDYEGQVRRLRSADGVHFTKAGALKLGHLVERDLQRLMQARNAPVATIPPIEQAAPTQPTGPAPRPDAGPVVSLTGPNKAEGLVGGVARAPATDPTAARVLVKGESASPTPGRADDFSWPRSGNAAGADEVIPVIQAAPATPRPTAPKKTTTPVSRRPGQAAATPPTREREARRPDG